MKHFVWDPTGPIGQATSHLAYASQAYLLCNSAIKCLKITLKIALSKLSLHLYEPLWTRLNWAHRLGHYTPSLCKSGLCNIKILLYNFVKAYKLFKNEYVVIIWFSFSMKHFVWDPTGPIDLATLHLAYASQAYLICNSAIKCYESLKITLKIALSKLSLLLFKTLCMRLNWAHWPDYYSPCLCKSSLCNM